MIVVFGAACHALKLLWVGSAIVEVAHMFGDIIMLCRIEQVALFGVEAQVHSGFIPSHSTSHSMLFGLQHHIDGDLVLFQELQHLGLGHSLPKRRVHLEPFIEARELQLFGLDALGLPDAVQQVCSRHLAEVHLLDLGSQG